MDALGIGMVDLVVIGIIVFGGLIGLITGFLRGGLFVLSWIGAIFATLHGLPQVRPIAREYIQPGYAADLAAGAGLFLVSLILLHFVSHLLSSWVRQSRMNVLDRSLGMVAGLATSVFILGAAFLAISNFSAPEEQPAFIQEAKVLPLIERAALTVRRLAPRNLQDRFGVALEESRRRADSLEETRRVFERLATPPPTDSSPALPGYGSSERRQLNRLIEGAR